MRTSSMRTSNNVDITSGVRWANGPWSCPIFFVPFCKMIMYFVRLLASSVIIQDTSSFVIIVVFISFSVPDDKRDDDNNQNPHNRTSWNYNVHWVNCT